jgi:zinc metalloprotease ZmpA
MFKALPLFALCLCQTPFLAAQEESLLAARDQSFIQDLGPRLGLTREDALRVRAIVPDPLMEGHSARLSQYYRGVKVLGGEGILHMSGPRVRSVTDAFLKDLALDTTPGVGPEEALAVAVKALDPKGPFLAPPATELMAARLEGKDRLVYRIHLELRNGAAETLDRDYLVDAQTGLLLRTWSSLCTGRAAVGEGLSQYSGTVALNTTRRGKKYELLDWTRGHTGNTTVNMNNQTEGKGVPYLSATDSWGDGQNYSGKKSASRNGETDAVDAAFGLQATWDYYGQVFGRKGIDGKGTAVSMRVHYDTSYDNAFWSDSCFCVSLGDGQYYKSLNSLDVIGHELSHGVCATTAGLEYFGESGGLNEANSDIQGTMVEFHTRGGKGAAIGSWGGNWTIGEDLPFPAHPTPLRYLYKPSKDGSSPDAWSSDLAFMDVHNSSGPMNRCFFFLSQGSSPNPKSDFYTCYLPSGMEGLDNDRAAKIWYRALTHYLTSKSDYHDARKACIDAARDLYGTEASPEEKAVWNAFHGINVGLAWK